MGKRTVASLVGAPAIYFLAFCVSGRSEPGGYVGSAACSGCHKKLYDDFVRTPMGRSMSPAKAAASLPQPDAPIIVVNQKLNRHFAVFRQGSNLYQSEYELDAAGKEVFKTTHKAEYAVGSGVNGYSYIVQRGDHLFQAPLSFYSRAQKWDLSPGYEFADYGFSRPIAPACIACHSGFPQPVRERAGMYQDPPFRELAIGCENCHGPGQLHAAQGGKASIVNPAKLPRRLAEDICMNCHQGGDTRVLQPGKDHSDFRPGTPLIETLAIFRIPPKRGDPAESDLLEHHVSMRLSKCYRSSNGRLSCLTCHNPHATPSPAAAAGYYRARCLTCHTEASCSAPLKQRQGVADACAVCHMPKRDVQVISHSSLTNHRIIAKAGQPDPAMAYEQASPELPDLILVNQPPEWKKPVPALTLLRAYGELMEKEPAYRERYLALLEQLRKSAPRDPLVLAALGRKALRESTPDSSAKAVEYLLKAVDAGSTAPTTYEDAAEALARTGRLEEAVSMLKRGIVLSPYAAVLHKSLALRYITLKRYAEARETMTRYLEIFPEDSFMRGLLARVNGPAAQP